MSNELDGNIVTLADAKLWLRIDSDDEVNLIEMLIASSENYLKSSTGIEFDNTNHKAKLFCLVLITDWYENRELIGKKPSEKVRFTVQSMLMQLTYGEEK